MFAVISDRKGILAVKALRETLGLKVLRVLRVPWGPWDRREILAPRAPGALKVRRVL